MSNPVIIAENLSKSYLLTHKKQGSYISFRDVLTDKVRNLIQKKGRLSESREEFFALNDVSFQINSGDQIGIIGRNGAGKSTLLKILSRITTPTKGKVTIEGRVASLLEVGTGFHPELSGRENIFLNGSILGMNRKEIKRKFDEIVAFAEVEKFLDTPVKRYSSGMYVRLAFAVAAHLEPEILIVDEVLAVGDAQFQRKCLGKMEDIAGTGRTTIFVSHNMQAVQKLCTKGILLRRGKIISEGKIDGVINSYLESSDSSVFLFDIERPDNFEESTGYAYRLRIEDENGEPSSEIPVGKNWQVRVYFHLNKYVEHFIIALGIVTPFDLALQTSWSEAGNFSPGKYEVVFKNQEVLLTSGQYKLAVGLSSHEKPFQYVENAAWLTISDAGFIDVDKRVVNTKSGLLLNSMNITFEKK